MMVPVSELFEVRYGHSLELNRLRLMDQTKGGIPFVSRKMGDNGISAYVEPVPGEIPAAAGQLSCALGGNGVLSTFLQEIPFYSGRDVAHLFPKVKMSKPQLLYYCTVIVANRYRFSYGRQANRTLKSILVPSVDEIPDFVEKADVDRFDGCDRSTVTAEPIELNIAAWKAFAFEDLFDIKKGRRLTKANMKLGLTPFIGSTCTVMDIT